MSRRHPQNSGATERRLQPKIETRDAPGVQMHVDQLSVSLEMVRRLVDEQFPEWRRLPIGSIASQGTVNAIFRRELVGRTRFPTPKPVALGEPAAGYPLAWSVQTWLPGVAATDEDPGESVAFAHDLAEFINDVLALDTRGRTFSGEGRGGDLQSHDAWMETCFRHSEQLLDVARLRRMWAVVRSLPRRAAGDAMTHGDLIPGNVLVSNGRLAGILDVGGLGPADPAVDLVSAWHLLEAGPRQVLREDLGCDDLEWERGKAWAFEQAMGAVWYYVESNPAMSRMGQRTLERIMADESSA